MCVVLRPSCHCQPVRCAQNQLATVWVGTLHQTLQLQDLNESGAQIYAHFRQRLSRQSRPTRPLGNMHTKKRWEPRRQKTHRPVPFAQTTQNAKHLAPEAAGRKDSLLAVPKPNIRAARQQVLHRWHVALVNRPVQQGRIVLGVARVGLDRVDEGRELYHRSKTRPHHGLSDMLRSIICTSDTFLVCWIYIYSAYVAPSASKHSSQETGLRRVGQGYGRGAQLCRTNREIFVNVTIQRRGAIRNHQRHRGFLARCLFSMYAPAVLGRIISPQGGAQIDRCAYSQSSGSI